MLLARQSNAETPVKWAFLSRCERAAMHRIQLGPVHTPSHCPRLGRVPSESLGSPRYEAEVSGGECQEVFFGAGLEQRLPERMRNLAKTVRLEKSDEFKRCIKENPDKHQMCRDTADKRLETSRLHRYR